MVQVNLNTSFGPMPVIIIQTAVEIWVHVALCFTIFTDSQHRKDRTLYRNS